MTCQLMRSEGLKCRGDDPWDVFIADEDERDPDPEPGDFWPDDDLPCTDADHFDRRFRADGWEVRPCSL